MLKKFALLFGVLGALLISVVPAHAAGIFLQNGLSLGLRWDADPRMIGGVERSLDGGLRYSLQGSSFEAYRDLFSWQPGKKPGVAEFETAVKDAFKAWTVTDPVSKLASGVSFATDLKTNVVRTGNNLVGLFPGATLGAEIDLFAANLNSQTAFGVTAIYSPSIVNPTTVTLTSGTQMYQSFVMSGSDITINNNPNAKYTLDLFQILLTHEIGHAIGLADVDLFSGPAGLFIDDNYFPSTPANIVATLTNSWAHLVNAGDPSRSRLQLYEVPNNALVLDRPGVEILMESQTANERIGKVPVLANDDFGGRQFLYPTPEPSSLMLFGSGSLIVLAYARRRRRQAPGRGRRAKVVAGHL